MNDILKYYVKFILNEKRGELRILSKFSCEIVWIQNFKLL